MLDAAAAVVDAAVASKPSVFPSAVLIVARDGEPLLRHTGCQELGLTSPDGKYTVIEVECLGACGFATPIMINEDFIESVTPETVPGVLATRP